MGRHSTMRCVSKCFIGRPFRVYSLLILGVIVGFSLSTILQSLDFESLQRTAGTIQKIVDYREISRTRVEFANLEDEQIDPETMLGDYDYDSMIFEEDPPLDIDSPSLQENEGANKHPMFDTPPMEDSQLKQREYLNENWHGRNVRETVDGLPANKLSEELAPRETLLVAVITSVAQLMSQTLAIQGTWAVGAKHVIYFTGEVLTMPHLPHGMVVVQLEGIDDKQAGWEIKEFSAMQYLLEHYLETTDWFLIIGDETYVVPNALEQKLNMLDARMPVYMGRPVEDSNEAHELCDSLAGIVYSRGLVERLKPYLPMCWPGQGEMHSLSGCISVMGLKCTQAKEAQELFLSDAKSLVESTGLFTSKELSKALIVHPVKYPKFMYRLHSYFKEIEYNESIAHAKAMASVIKDTHPFIPSHLRSSFHPDQEATTAPPLAPTAGTTSPTPPDNGIVVRPRHVPKNKFEMNYWEYFNQTRLMTIMNESPARGIIGGIREEARYALTKAIYLANQGLPQSQRFIFDKLENGYHRVDPMRGSEFILDFIFRRNSDRNTRIKKRISILRPYHESVVPVETPEMLPTINFVVVLSGLSSRLEHFMLQYERNVLQLGEDATLTIVLFDSPDASKVRLMVQQYTTRYQGAAIFIVDSPGEFARGAGLHKGTEHFRDDQLLFLVDVDLDISTDFLQRCRLNTMQGKQVYFPVFFKLYHQDFVNQYHRGNTSMLISRQNGHWAHYSYGMACIYGSDYRKAGGFNLDMHGWGEEDVDFLNRVLEHGLEVFRAPDPGLIHNWHRKVCNKATVTNGAAYEHCLMSKGENLADRIELAQYVFESELRKGNVL